MNKVEHSGMIILYIGVAMLCISLSFVKYKLCCRDTSNVTKSSVVYYIKNTVDQPFAVYR